MLLEKLTNKLFGKKGRNTPFTRLLIEAGRTLTYVQTIKAESADTLHRNIKKVYFEDIRLAYGNLVIKQLKRLKIKNVELAIDSKRDPYWGKKSQAFLRGYHERGTNKAHEWVIVSITKPHSFPLMALPLKLSSQRAEVTIELIKYAMSLPIKIKKCTLDRGFYSSRLLAFMENSHFPYLMLAPSSNALQKYELKTKIIANFRHLMHKNHSEKERVKITILIVKDAKKQITCFYATNLKPCLRLHFDYKKRWQIETDFRVMNEVKIKTKSNIHIIRYFYVIVQLVMLISWQAYKKLKDPILFKRFLLAMVDILKAEKIS